MNSSLVRLAAFITTLLIPPFISHAQMGGAGSPGAMNPAMLKLFGKNTAFTAKGAMRTRDKEDKETMSLVIDTAFLDGKMRQDIDMGQMKSAMMPPQMVAQMKQMGMDKMSVIVRPDKKASLLIYPGLKAYVEMPLSQEDAAALNEDWKMEKKELGRETIDGHATIKNKVTMTDANGKQVEATVWNATDLKDFPVQTEVIENGQKVVLNYKNVQFTKPEVKQFDAPVGFTKYDNVQKLMMEKMMGAANAK